MTFALLFAAAIPGGYDYVTDPLNKLLSAYAGTFLGIGSALLSGFQSAIFVFFMFINGWSFVSLVRFLLRYTVRLFLANAFLFYFDRPMSFCGGYKLHQLPSEVCDTLVSYLDMTRLDAMFSFFKDYLGSLHIAPTDLNVRFGVWLGETAVTMYEAVLWAAIPLSYAAVSVLTLLLPIFTFTLLIPGLSHWFWNGVQAIWQSAFYRVIAAAIGFCAATSTLAFLAHVLSGDYSAEMFVAVLPKLSGLMLAWLLSFLVVGHLVNDWFKGTSSAGAGFGGTLSRMFL